MTPVDPKHLAAAKVASSVSMPQRKAGAPAPAAPVDFGPQEETPLPAPVNPTTGGAKDALRAAAAGAVKGAVVGGGAGAAAGAAKAGAQALLSNKKIQGILIAVVIFIIAGCIAIPAGMSALVLYSLGSTSESDDNGSMTAAMSSGATIDEINVMQNQPHAGEVPWQLSLAVKRKTGSIDINRLYAAISAADPDARYRDMSAGSVYDGTKDIRRAGDTSEQKSEASAVRDLYVGALKRYGIPDPDAGNIYDQGLRWVLGQGTMCSAVPADGSGAGAVSGSVTLPAEMQANAVAILGVAKSMFPAADQNRAAIVGLATAMQESGLHVLNYGDAAGPDSRGLFQQRASWGALAVRMDPAGAANLFFQRLTGVTGWQTMTLGDAAYAVQVFRDGLQPRYTAFEAWATAFVTANAGAPATATATATVAVPASGATDASGCAVLTTSGWTAPLAIGTTSVGYSDFFGPRTGLGRAFHYGIDLSAPEGTPVHAAAAGTVTVSEPSGTDSFGNTIIVSEPDGTFTQYSHLLAGTLTVKVTDTVAAGQVIAGVGRTGEATGTHLDFRTFTGPPSDSTAQDPVAFLLARGVDLRGFPILHDLLLTVPTF